MNSLMKYIAGRRLAKLRKKIENVEGELTYYEFLREESLLNEIPEERETRLIVKLNNLYLFSHNLNQKLAAQ